MLTTATETSEEKECNVEACDLPATWRIEAFDYDDNSVSVYYLCVEDLLCMMDQMQKDKLDGKVI